MRPPPASEPARPAKSWAAQSWELVKPKLSATKGSNEQLLSAHRGCTRRSRQGQPVEEPISWAASQKATPFCIGGYVSGTIHALKKGTSPHPQGTGPTGLKADGWCCPFCFMWMEE